MITCEIAFLSDAINRSSTDKVDTEVFLAVLNSRRNIAMAAWTPPAAKDSNRRSVLDDIGWER